MRDITIIALLLTLAAAVPLLIRLFTNNATSSLPDAPETFNDDGDGDGDDSLPTGEWPSIIEVTGLETLPQARLESEYVSANAHCRV